MGEQSAFTDHTREEIILSDESDDEGEDDPLCPTIRIPNEDKRRIRRKWRKSLIFRTLGKSFPHAFLSRKIQQIWARKGRVAVWDIGFGHFVARFDEEADYNRAFLEGPWLVGDHYVVSEEWRPNFEPGYSQVTNIRVWVRLPGLPLENFDVEVLKLVGDKIGKTIRVDGTTLFGSRGNYARLCVEVDLHKPLISKYRLHRRVRRIEYEGLHEICFECGRYGHERKACPESKDEDVADSQEQNFSNPLFHDDADRPEIIDDYGPWMLAKKNMRRRKPQLPKTNGRVVKSDQMASTATGSRFVTLVDCEEDGTENVIRKEAPCIPPVGDNLTSTHQKGEEHVQRSKAERKLNFNSNTTTVQPSACDVVTPEVVPKEITGSRSDVPQWDQPEAVPPAKPISEGVEISTLPGVASRDARNGETAKNMFGMALVDKGASLPVGNGKEVKVVSQKSRQGSSSTKFDKVKSQKRGGKDDGGGRENGAAF
ncbi:hypothetical protein LINPERHAP2_LOCUS27953 [Linum perenne]